MYIIKIVWTHTHTYTHRENISQKVLSKKVLLEMTQQSSVVENLICLLERKMYRNVYNVRTYVCTYI